jgi:hypothetical protein
MGSIQFARRIAHDARSAATILNDLYAVTELNVPVVALRHRHALPIVTLDGDLDAGSPAALTVGNGAGDRATDSAEKEAHDAAPRRLTGNCTDRGTDTAADETAHQRAIATTGAATTG